MSELLHETVIPLSGVARMLPGSRPGKQINPSTIYRWATTGTTTRDGRRVKLEHFRAGGRIHTSLEAVKRYIAELDCSGRTDETPIRSVSKRRIASEKASKALTEMGA